jgi:hypothetical protein
VVQNVMPEVRRIGAQVGAEERAATDFAKQRTQEETGIRTGARAALEGARRDIYGDVDEAVLQAQDQNADLQALYDEAKRTGSFEALDAIPGVDAGAFNTPGRQAVAEAEQRRAEIMGDPRFAAVADIPPLELTINKRGREKFSLAGDESDRELWKEVTGGDLTREEFKLLKERQQALEAYFSPGSKKSKEGALSTVAPLYHGEDLGEFAPADYRPYIGIDPGVAPERENLATTDQRYVVNMASDLLGEAERLDDAGEPFRAAAVFAQGQKYLEDEARELEARKETLDEREKTHLRAVNKARKKYKKAMHQRPMLKVGRIISSLPAPGAAWIPNTGMDKLIQTGIEPFVRA